MEDYYHVKREQEAMQVDSKKNEEVASNAEEMKAFNRIDRERWLSYVKNIMF